MALFILAVPTLPPQRNVHFKTEENLLDSKCFIVRNHLHLVQRRNILSICPWRYRQSCSDPLARSTVPLLVLFPHQLVFLNIGWKSAVAEEDFSSRLIKEKSPRRRDTSSLIRNHEEVMC